MLIEKATKLIKNKKPSAIKIGSRITSKKDVNVTRTSRIYVECQKKCRLK